MNNIEFLYNIDIPRNEPCFQVNPKLWLVYNQLRLDRGLDKKLENNLVTEQNVVIEIDLELLNNE